MLRTNKLAIVAGIAGLTGLFGVACDVHDGYFDGEFNAGGADPYDFPPPYRGTGAIRQTAASGTFTEIGAYAKGKEIGYYFFPFSPSQVATTNYAAPPATTDPLRVVGPGTDFRVSTRNPVPTPMVYNFDPPGTSDPFPERPRCRIPAGYTHDEFAEGVPRNDQWNIFTFLPDRFTTFGFGALPTWSYRPVVAEVTVTTNKLDCQAVKSERTLLTLEDSGNVSFSRGELEKDNETRLGLPTPDRFLAWALIDPGAAVVRVGETVNITTTGTVNGTSVQKYGWYGQFIVAYIDGGYIPVVDGPAATPTDQGPDALPVPTKRMRPQRIYYPRSAVISPGGSARGAPGRLGAGYDVLQANRFDDPEEYSPVCEVWTYSLPRPTPIDELPKDEATIIATANSTLEPARTDQPTTSYTPSAAIVPRYMFCLQAAPLPPKTTP